MAAEAATIWIGPKESVAQTHEQENGNDEESPNRRQLRESFWRGLSDYLIAEHPELPKLEPRQSWTIRLPSGVRHIGLELRFALRDQNVGVDIWFWRDASFPLWEKIKATPEEFNGLIKGNWEFERVDGKSRGRMSINQAGETRKEAAWGDLYPWLSDKLSLVYGQVLPKLGAAMDHRERKPA
jgi:hypothetical protein